MTNAAVLANERAYRLCKAVIDYPLLRSSAYPKLAGIGPAKAKTIREELVRLGCLRVHLQDTGRRGRSAMMLETTPLGLNAVREWESTHAG